MTSLTETTPLLIEEDAAQAYRAGSAIARFAQNDEHVKLTLSHDDGQRIEVSVPAFAVRLLARALKESGNGRQVTVVPMDTELTTHQAADLLGVSRPYLIKQMEAGKLPFRKVGTHRRIRYDDLLAYEERDREERFKGLAELIALSQEMGLYDDEVTGDVNAPE